MVLCNRFSSLRLVGGILAALGASLLPLHATPKDRDIQAHFSAGTGCSDELVKTIGAARWFINLQASHQICDPVINALIDARKRGVQVEVILDKGAKAQTNATADALVKAGIKTYIDAKHGMAHSSLLIVDEGQIVTGSFDFTKAPDDSASENILIISDTALTAKYLESWRSHVQHAALYGAKRR